MPDSLPIDSLNHTAILTRDVERSKSFYRDVLGFREVARPNFDFQGAWLFNYGLVVHLIHGDTATYSTGEIQSRGNHLAFQVKDLARAERLLAEHGVEVRVKQLADTGITQIFFRDPDGNVIEVAQYPPTPEFI